MRAIAAAGCAIVAIGLVATRPAGQVQYRAQASVVVVDVAVTDGRKPVPNLTREDFELRDNGVVQEILDFSRETLPLDVAIVIDISGSMTPTDRTAVMRAIEQVGGALRDQDRASVTTFDSRIVQRSTLQPPPLRVDLQTIGPGTSVLDALLLSLVTAPPIDRRQFVLFMTDGQDTSSYFDARTVLETAKHAGAPVTIVLVPDRSNSATRDVGTSVARTTGGEVIELKRHAELGGAFRTALENFRTSYMLRYTPSGVTREGWHDLTVSVRGRKYDVRARRGYVGWPGS
jgi:VWFA-related protein